MRKNIGWQEKTEEIKYEIRVQFDGGERILWRRIAKHLDRWEPFEPTAEHWGILRDKMQSRYVRRQAPYKDVQLVDRLARAAGA